MSVLDMGQRFEESDGRVEYPVAEPGVYDARITGIEDVVTGDNSQHPGSPMWKISFKIECPEDEVADGMNLSMWQMLPNDEWMDERAMKNRVAEIKKLWMDTGAPSEGGEVDSDDLVNLQCRINITKEADKKKEGAFRNNVQGTLPM